MLDVGERRPVMMHDESANNSSSHGDANPFGWPPQWLLACVLSGSPSLFALLSKFQALNQYLILVLLLLGRNGFFPRRHATACPPSLWMNRSGQTSVLYLWNALHLPCDSAIQIIEVVNKTLAFHTSVNYQIQAPPPYDKDVHEDLVADLARISTESYSSEFDFHIDIYRSFKRVNDGHCGVFNFCYDCEQTFMIS